MATATPNHPTQSDRFLPSQGLLVNQALFSPDERFNMTLKADGNFVLYGPQGQHLWMSGPVNRDVFKILMQNDGNLVIYDNNDNALWASGTAGAPGAILILHNDGNAAIVGTDNTTLWASNTVVPITPDEPSTPRDRLIAGQGLSLHESLYSANGNYRLVLQDDGNLVQYGPNNKQLWASNTSGNPNVWDAIMQPDGNFVVYKVSGRSLWASDTSGNNGATFLVEDGGGLVIYDVHNQSLWSHGNVTLSTLISGNSTMSTPSANSTISPVTGSSNDAEIAGGVIGGVILILLVGFVCLAVRKRRGIRGMINRRNERSSANLERGNSFVRVSVNQDQGERECVERIAEETN
jgi:hypothetical protein